MTRRNIDQLALAAAWVLLTVSIVGFVVCLVNRWWPYVALYVFNVAVNIQNVRKGREILRLTARP